MLLSPPAKLYSTQGKRGFFTSPITLRQTNVAVIGAGIVGLVQAKILADDGFKVTIFTRDKAVGGTWNSDRIYPGLRTNRSESPYYTAYNFGILIEEMNLQRLRDFLFV